MSDELYRKPSFERLRMALLLEGEPDRVPLVEPAVEKEVKEAVLGRPVNDLQSEIAFWAHAGYDYVPLMLGVRTLLQYRQQQYQTKGETGLIGPARRARSRYSLYTDTNTERAWAEEGRGSILSMEDFNRFGWPAPADIDCSILDDVKVFLPSGMKVIAVFGYIFNPTWRLMGFEHFCESLYEQPELIEALVETLGTLEYETAKRVMQHDVVGAIWLAEDLAYSQQLMVAPKHLRKYLFPWYKRIGELAREHGLPYIHHSDGCLYDVVDDLIECGVNALHPIEPKAMDIGLLKRKYRGRLCLVGNIDMAYTLTLGTPAEVEAEVRQRIKDCAPGGGYCLASGGGCITEYVPIENYNMMREACLRYGRYPIQIEG